MENELILALEPLNSHTNFMIVGGLIALGIFSEGTDFSVFTDKGKNTPRPRWKCPYNLTSALVATRKTEKEVRFKIWIRKGAKSFSDGEFLFKKKKNKKPRN